jgi:hypothetical protein
MCQWSTLRLELPFSVTARPAMIPARIRATGITGRGSYTIGYRIFDLLGTLDQTRLTCP